MVSGLSQSAYETENPDLVILLDDSGSMAEGQPSPSSGSTIQQTNRFQQAIQVLTEEPARFERLQKQYQLQIRTFTQSIPPDRETLMKLDAQHNASPIGRWWQESLSGQRGRRTAAVVMLTDGIVTEGASLESASQFAAAQGVPLVAIGLGSDQPPIDVRIEDVLTDSWVLLGDLVQVQAWVRLAGVTAGTAVQVQLIDQESGATLDQQSVRATGKPQQEKLTFQFVPQCEGDVSLAVEATELAGEIDTENNRRELVIDVRNQPLKVLLVQDQPSYEYRYLKHILERARAVVAGEPADAEPPELIDLTVVLQSGDPRYARQDRAAEVLPPVGVSRLGAFDVIILSDAAASLLGEVFLQQVAEVVTQRGVGLMVIAGPRHLPAALAGTPLDQLLPVDPGLVAEPSQSASVQRIRLTLLGQQTASLQLSDAASSGSLPGVTAVWQARRLRPLARILLETDRSTPLLLSQLVGAGQVRLQLTDEMFRLESFDGTGRLHERYWLQTIRDLARGKRRAMESPWRIEIADDTFLEGASVPVTVSAATRQEQIRLQALSAGHTQELSLQPVEPGGTLFQGHFQQLPAGDYRVMLIEPLLQSGDPPQASFRIEAAPYELQRLDSDFEGLRQAAAVTEGQFLTWQQALGDAFESAIPAADAIKIRPLAPLPIWNHPLVAMLLFAMLTGEWLLRRRWGLL